MSFKSLDKAYGVKFKKVQRSGKKGHISPWKPKKLGNRWFRW